MNGTFIALVTISHWSDFLLLFIVILVIGFVTAFMVRIFARPETTIETIYKLGIGLVALLAIYLLLHVFFFDKIRQRSADARDRTHLLVEEIKEGFKDLKSYLKGPPPEAREEPSKSKEERRTIMVTNYAEVTVTNVVEKEIIVARQTDPTERRPECPPKSPKLPPKAESKKPTVKHVREIKIVKTVYPTYCGRGEIGEAFVHNLFLCLHPDTTESEIKRLSEATHAFLQKFSEECKGDLKDLMHGERNHVYQARYRELLYQEAREWLKQYPVDICRSYFEIRS